MNDIYKGRGLDEDNAELVAELNDIFFADDPPESKSEFLKMLPKLYKDKYRPAYNNFVIKENGRIKAAVGLYPWNVSVGGDIMKVGGIGNVGVSRDSRGKGYMRECMAMALEQMKNDGTDYSLLGGQRQRYNHFGYDEAGTGYRFTVDNENFEHIRGKNYSTTFTCTEVMPDDKETLAKINALFRKSPFYAIREEDNLYDILCTWNCRPYAVRNEGEFKGYFCESDTKDIGELYPVNAEDLLDVAICAAKHTGKNGISFSFSPLNTELCAAAEKLFDSCTVHHTELINIFNYKHFLKAYLSLKSGIFAPADGSLVLLIHGFRCDERLEITVKNGKVSVEDTDKEADMELDHLEATRMIASISSVHRSKLPAFAGNWFPVYIFCTGLDNV